MIRPKSKFKKEGFTKRDGEQRARSTHRDHELPQKYKAAGMLKSHHEKYTNLKSILWNSFRVITAVESSWFESKHKKI